MAGGDPEKSGLHGKDIRPYLTQQSKAAPHEVLYWHTRREPGLGGVIRDGKFKLIHHVTDNNTKDNWAKLVGYYVLTLNKEEEKFTFLTDAVEKHDKSVVERNGEKTTKADLYQPKNLKALLKEFRAKQSKTIRYVDWFILSTLTFSST